MTRKSPTARWEIPANEVCCSRRSWVVAASVPDAVRSRCAVHSPWWRGAAEAPRNYARGVTLMARLAWLDASTSIRLAFAGLCGLLADHRRSRLKDVLPWLLLVLVLDLMVVALDSIPGARRASVETLVVTLLVASAAAVGLRVRPHGHGRRPPHPHPGLPRRVSLRPVRLPPHVCGGRRGLPAGVSGDEAARRCDVADARLARRRLRPRPARRMEPAHDGAAAQCRGRSGGSRGRRAHPAPPGPLRADVDGARRTRQRHPHPRRAGRRGAVEPQLSARHRGRRALRPRCAARVDPSPLGARRAGLGTCSSTVEVRLVGHGPGVRQGRDQHQPSPHVGDGRPHEVAYRVVTTTTPGRPRRGHGHDEHGLAECPAPPQHRVGGHRRPERRRQQRRQRTAQVATVLVLVGGDGLLQRTLEPGTRPARRHPGGQPLEAHEVRPATIPGCRAHPRAAAAAERGAGSVARGAPRRQHQLGRGGHPAADSVPQAHHCTPDRRLAPAARPRGSPRGCARHHRDARTCGPPPTPATPVDRVSPPRPPGPSPAHCRPTASPPARTADPATRPPTGPARRRWR